MKIETKYKIGDKVFYITEHHEQTIIKCDVCGDTKQVDIKGVLYNCPKCKNGISNYHTRWFVHTTPTTIGQINLEVKLKAYHSCNYFDESEIEGDEGAITEKYMISATGIGSGSLWPHSQLFLTLEEAQNEADKRNQELIDKENSLLV